MRSQSQSQTFHSILLVADGDAVGRVTTEPEQGPLSTLIYYDQEHSNQADAVAGGEGDADEAGGQFEKLSDRRAPA